MSIVPAFKKNMQRKRRSLRYFLSRLEKFSIPGIHKIREAADKEAWRTTDCLSCANCCKTMTPTFTEEDLNRISAHLNMTKDAFIKKWLYKDRNGDWMNRKQPCQFLNLADNKCRIYEVRPLDCSGFPHHTKRNMDDYMHVYKQNIAYCPATLKWVEQIKERVEADYNVYGK